MGLREWIAENLNDGGWEEPLAHLLKGTTEAFYSALSASWFSIPGYVVIWISAPVDLTFPVAGTATTIQVVAPWQGAIVALVIGTFYEYHLSKRCSLSPD